MFTMGTRTTYHPIGSVLDPADPTARVEVCLVHPHRPSESPIVYVTKYQGRAVGERSVGLSAEIADEIAAMLRIAATMGRTQQPEKI